MSAEVAMQKFSFPFSCGGPDLSQRSETAPDACVQVKALELHNLQANLSEPGLVKVMGVCNEVQGGSKSEQDQCTVMSRKNVFEKLTAETEDQRPVAKRQLSSESAARTITVVKKSAVRKDGEDNTKGVKPKTVPIPKLGLSTTGTGRRRHRKDLFSSSEVFQRVDDHVIRVGAELKEKSVYDVKTIALGITQAARTELERLRAIWVWLCHNIGSAPVLSHWRCLCFARIVPQYGIKLIYIHGDKQVVPPGQGTEYDISGFLGRSEKLSSPEEVIAAGRGVCCGYSSLCSEMCREVGIECQEVPGHSKGVGYRQGQSLRGVKSDHLWNAVLLSGQWFLLDACWGAGRVDMEHESFVKRFDDFYFLTDAEEFIHSHFPDEERWQLLDCPISIEEFERRVFKTSAFFTLGLRLMQPHHSHILTDDGEANISLGFSRPTIFTFETTAHRDLLHAGSSEQRNSTKSSFGLLTVSHRTMKLQLLPPASGTYDVKIYARPEAATTPLKWVCAFTVECPVPRAMEEIPENPFLSWGLQPNAEAQGVSGSSLGSEVAQIEQGSCEVVLKTSRPLMLVCELAHPELDPAVAKRCLATQIQSNALTCHVLFPQRGFYRLSVFVRDYEKTEVKFNNAANFLLRCKGKLTSLDELFPPHLGSACGPGVRTSEFGFSKFSHTTGVVSTQQGKCNITFHNQQDLELHTVLSREEITKRSSLPLSRYLFCTYTDSKVTVSASMPERGVYRLGLYARTTPGDNFDPMCDFVLRNTCDQAGAPFPCVYSAWRKGSVLFEPRIGLLEAGSWVRFRVRVPGAQRVCVVGETRTDLKLNKSRVWEADVYTGGVQQLKLAAASGEGADMAVMMTFDIRPQEKEE